MSYSYSRYHTHSHPFSSLIVVVALFSFLPLAAHGFSSIAPQHHPQGDQRERERQQNQQQPQKQRQHQKTTGLQTKTAIDKIVDSYTGQQFKITLDIGTPNDDQSRLAVTGMVLRLDGDIVSPDDGSSVVAMPNTGSSTDPTSSIRKKSVYTHKQNPRRLTLVQEGSFVSMAGQTSVEALGTSCWDLLLKDEGAAHGSLLCGFEIPHDYKRNDNPDNSASLKKGPAYISWTIWNRDTLTDLQKQKEETLQLAEEIRQTMETEAAKFNDPDTTLFQKAIHFRNSAAAKQKYPYRAIAKLKNVPEADEIISVTNANQQDDDGDHNNNNSNENKFVICTKGAIWTTDNLSSGRLHHLGSASLE